MEILRREVAEKELSLETGRLAKQANGAVVARTGDTMVLATVCAAKEAREGQAFFPLTVEFQEKSYAAGKIPGGFFKREGRLSEQEILTCRLTDRPLRPLFPEGFLNEVQIICTVMSADKENPADVLGLIAASAALNISDVPFEEPVAAVRLGRVNNQFVVNPTMEVLEKHSSMNVLVAGTESSIIMVEGSAKQVEEKVMAEGLFFAHQEMQPIIEMQKEMKQKRGKPKMAWQPPRKLDEVESFVRSEFTESVKQALSRHDKQERHLAQDQAKEQAVAKALEKFTEEEADLVEKTAANAIEDIAYDVMRKDIVESKKRIDGRDLTTVRPIEIEVGVLPRAHGSALFQRGETQALVTCTLGAADDSQRIDALVNEYEKHFMLHYNFPPFSVGEVKGLRGPSRRDIGHGQLAEHALASLVPDKVDFPYTLRVVSDILESNGSSSMATVCGGSLAMMDAGVPIEQATAGVAMGLVAEDGKMEVLTDILGDEDHLGDMDFKVTGTRTGITAFQLDTKISGISLELMEKALNQAKDARLEILDKMASVLEKPRLDTSRFAPKVKTLQIRQNKIKDVIGPGGKNIRSVIDATGAKVDISDDGKVNIFSTDPDKATKAVELIEALCGEIEVGKIYSGTVRKIMDFGAFVNIAPGADGLVHISELAEEHVRKVDDILKEGDQVEVKVLEIDRQGRIRLSRKQAMVGKAV